MMPLTYSKEEQIADVQMERPHVIVLGAGASRATCPAGDRYGQHLPLMADFSSSLALDGVLCSWGVDPTQNFEDLYSYLNEAGEATKLAQLEQRVEAYFENLSLPDIPTIYDYLVLSLRKTDLIATFNWDPLLLQAYRRTPNWFSKPSIAFLHGNVGVGYCDADEVTGIAGNRCSCCGAKLRRTPLLYPVRHKDYSADPAIAAHWALFRSCLEDAFMLTVFGYSGPKTDAEAIAAMSGAWGSVDQRAMEQTAFITLQTDEEISAAWDRFIHTHHYETQRDFFDSWLARHPRRTGETYLSQYFDVRFVEANPAPRGVTLGELWRWHEQFRKAEDDARGM